MTWIRWGDTAANHPIVLNVLEHEDCDERLVNEVMGFISRCASQAGAHKTDYVITRGTAVLIAGQSRVDALLAVSLFAGFLTEVTLDDARRAYKLVDDDHEFVHIRLREEIEWEQQRRKDNSNYALVVPVRYRDGDACRWCGRIVDWKARKSARSGTYDHLIAGQAATVDTYVVACVSCNSSRKDGSRPRGIETLQGVPEAPYYSLHTIEWLEGCDWRKRNGLPVPPKPRRRLLPGDLAPGMTDRPTAPADDRPDSPSGNDTEDLDTAPAARPASPAPRTDSQSVHAPAHPRPGNQPEHARNTGRPAETSDQRNSSGIPAEPAEREGTESVSTGRDGSGRVGSGSEPNPTPNRGSASQSSPSSKRSRGRRRRRSRTQNPQQGNH